MFSAKFRQLACIVLSGLLLIPLWSGAAESDFEKEKYWKKQLSDKIKIGEVIELKAGSNSFFSIYTKQNTATPKGSIILLHDKAGHPDWFQVINPMRTQLPDRGWNTLSIQLPIRTKPLKTPQELDTFYQQAFPRIDSAISYLKSQKEKNIVLVAHGMGASIALLFSRDHNLAKSATKPVATLAALVIISAPHIRTPEHPENSVVLLEKIKLPILDIYGMDDLDIVVQSAKARQGAAKRSGKKFYTQQVIFGADHLFTSQINMLITRVHSWLTATTKNK